MYTYEVVDTFDKFKKLQPLWNTLLDQSDIVDAPFMTFEWFASWWQYYGNNNKMFVILVREGSETVGIAPFMRTKMSWRGFPLAAISVMDNYACGETGLILQKQHEARKNEIMDSIFRYMQEHNSRCDILLSISVLKDSVTDKALTGVFRSRKLEYLTYPTDTSPYIPVQGNWEEYFRSRSRNLRSKLNRVRNLYKRAGDYKIVKYTEGNMEQAMNELLQVSKKTWKYKAGTAIASSPETTGFFSTLAESLSRKGWLDIWILKLNGTPIASAYNMKYKKKVYASKMGYDEDYKHLSPSEFLNAEAIKDAFENSMLEFNWLGKADTYKMKWTSFCREHQKYVVFNNTLAGKALYLFEANIVARLKGLRSVRRRAQETAE